MDQAEVLVATYVQAGFTQDPPRLQHGLHRRPHPARAARRGAAARLAQTAEKARSEDDLREVVYVVGTEVPVPRGAQETISALTPTAPTQHAPPLPSTTPPSPGSVPGLRPGDRPRGAARRRVRPSAGLRLRQAPPSSAQSSRTGPDLVFEAHSTDYQTRTGLAALVRDHWAVLKVRTRSHLRAAGAVRARRRRGRTGPGRPALAARRRSSKRDHGGRPDLVARLLRGDRGRAAPGAPLELRRPVPLLLAHPAVAQATDRLLANLEAIEILPLISQHLPEQYRRVRAGLLSANPRPGHRPRPRRAPRLRRRLQPGGTPLSRTPPHHPADAWTAARSPQPAVWRELQASLAAQLDTVDAFLAPMLARPDLGRAPPARALRLRRRGARPGLGRTLRRRVDAVAPPTWSATPTRCSPRTSPPAGLVRSLGRQPRRPRQVDLAGRRGQGAGTSSSPATPTARSTASPGTAPTARS